MSLGAFVFSVEVVDKMIFGKRSYFMKQWLNQVRRNVSQWMIGRYGVDEFSTFLIRAALVIMIIACVPKLSFLSTLSWTFLFIAIYRSCSKKITARSRERDWFLKKTEKVRARFQIYKRIWNERKTHRYFKCNKCKTFVRVPKGKGKIEITCTKCRNKMIRKS